MAVGAALKRHFGFKSRLQRVSQDSWYELWPLGNEGRRLTGTHITRRGGILAKSNKTKQNKGQWDHWSPLPRTGIALITPHDSALGWRSACSSGCAEAALGYRRSIVNTHQRQGTSHTTMEWPWAELSTPRGHLLYHPLQLRTTRQSPTLRRAGRRHAAQEGAAEAALVQINISVSY